MYSFRKIDQMLTKIETKIPINREKVITLYYTFAPRLPGKKIKVVIGVALYYSEIGLSQRKIARLLNITNRSFITKVKPYIEDLLPLPIIDSYP